MKEASPKLKDWLFLFQLSNDDLTKCWQQRQSIRYRS